jgi:hypothetical protein
MEAKGNAYKNLVGNLEGKRALGRPRRRQGNIKVYLIRRESG